LHVEVPALRYEELTGPAGESSAVVSSRVVAARSRQLERARRSAALTNADLDGPRAREIAALDHAGSRLLADAVNRLGLTGRAHDRLLRVALTLADLESAPAVRVRHVAEALQFRRCVFDTRAAPIAFNE
jgi:magnesium chelatase family protein